MYKVSIYNNNVETVVHYPSADQNDPHVSELPLKEGLSIVDTLSFSIYKDKPGFDSVYELTTKVKITDLRDNTIRFTGRILDINEKMDSSGIVYKELLCEGALSFFNDTKVRNAILFTSASNFITQLVNLHNAKVTSDKQIQVGNVSVMNNGSAIDGGFRTSLQVLKEFSDKYEMDIRVRESNNIRYLDCLTSFSSAVINITLGTNMKDMVKQKDITSLGTRIIPLGANNITIDSVNGGIDYIEDITAKNLYGIIEKTVEYRDITDVSVLKNTCIADLSKHTQALYVLESNALDLSYLSGNKAQQFVLGVNIHLFNPIMGIDSTYKIVDLDVDLLQPYNPKLTIANSKNTLSNTINDLRNTTIQQDGVYNNVQVGKSFGIRAVRTDKKAITTVNATDGIKIQTDRGSGLVTSFYVDTNGNVKINTYDEITGTLSSSLNVANTKISAVVESYDGGTTWVLSQNAFNVAAESSGLKAELDLQTTKISAIVESTDGGATWTLSKSAFIVAFNGAGGGYTEINTNGITIYEGKFKIKDGSNTVFYVSTSGRCTADGGFIVDDGDSKCRIDSSGVTITNDNGYSSSMYVDSGSSTLSTDDDFEVWGTLRAQSTFRAYSYAHCYDNVDIDYDLYVDGGLDVSGAKNCLQNTKNYGDRRISAYETAEYYFGDIGNGTIRNGECIVMIDDIFGECVNTDIQYQVDIFEYEDRGSIIKVERYPNYFIVKGLVDNIEFGWELKAKRIGSENIRLEQRSDKFNINTIELEKNLLTNNNEVSSTYLMESDDTGLEDILLEEAI